MHGYMEGTSWLSYKLFCEMPCERPITSLKALTKRDLERVYNLIMRES